jgi:hypothetical protein
MEGKGRKKYSRGLDNSGNIEGNSKHIFSYDFTHTVGS